MTQVAFSFRHFKQDWRVHKCKKLPERGGGLQLLNHLALRRRVTLSGVGTVERSLQANLGGELLLLGKAFFIRKWSKWRLV